MKKTLLLAIVAISLIACSGDDTPETTNPAVDKNLHKILLYVQDGDELIDESCIFVDNRMTERYLYDQGEPFYHDIYTYFQGRLIKREVTDDINGGHLVLELSYDSSGRISSQIIEVDSGYTEFTTYNYAEPGKIKTITYFSQGGQPEEKHTTYFLDDEGFVFKIESGNNVTILEYDSGRNVVSKTYIQNPGEENEETNVTLYTYDLETPVKGGFLQKDFIRFGDNNANYELYEGYNNYQPARSNYLIQTSSEGEVANTEYEFDEDGYPMSYSIVSNGEAWATYQIIYEED
ncbi:MAG TPA: hypothetical protein VEA37_00365 [Flavobacterium sp.]|nr:hypothetical protein [Flavobacterium sp.]